MSTVAQGEVSVADGDNDFDEVRAAFEGLEGMEDFRAMFADKTVARDFVDFAMPAPLRRYLGRLRRGSARLWHAERPMFETQRAYERRVDRVGGGHRPPALRLMARVCAHPAFPDFMGRAFTAIGARADRLVGDDPKAAQLVAFIDEFASAKPTQAGGIYSAVWDIDRAQREGVPRLWAALEPLEGVDTLPAEIGVRRVLAAYHQVAELGYRPYAAAFLKLLSAGEPAIKPVGGFGAAVWRCHHYLSAEWPAFVALADRDVVFLRNAAAHPTIEPLFPKRRYRLRDNPGGGRPPDVREFSKAELVAAVDRLIAFATPGGSIQRAADSVRFQLFLRFVLPEEVAKMRAALAERRDDLLRFANGDDVPGLFTVQTDATPGPPD